MNESKLSKAINMMMRTNHMHRTLIDSRVGTLGIHRTHHRILMHLAKCERLPSQKELAEHLDITPAAVTGAIKQIERDGYIKRSLGKDTRFYEIEITEKGRAIVALTHKLFSGVDSAMLEGFSDEELSDFMGYLERIQSNIKKQMTNEREKNSEKMV